MLKENNAERPTTPSNKIIVTFQKDAMQYKEAFLKRVFDQPSLPHNEREKRILKNLIWRTKYYELEYDLYIDEYEDLEEWLSELERCEYQELRDVLGGIIIVDEFNSMNTNYRKLLTQLDSSEFNSCFKVFCNVQRNMDQVETDKVNDDFSKQQVDVEVINWHLDDDINEYGEKIGIFRLKENIDTHEWHQCEPVMKITKLDNEFANDTEGDEEQTEPDLESILRRLQQARLRFANQELNDADASEMAEEVANEIMKYM